MKGGGWILRKILALLGLKTINLVLTYTKNVRAPWLNNKSFTEKERKMFLIFLMFTLAWILCQYNRCFVLLLGSSTCFGFMVWKADMNSKESSIIQKIKLSRKVPIIFGKCVKSCLKKNLNFQKTLPEVFLKNTVTQSLFNRTATLLKKRLNWLNCTIVFLWVLRILRTTVSEYCNDMPVAF